ncbi:hypothetical protein AX15_002979 [Amanita polypyramis BW_CC]|nr:hypothetical protein AX15_002979 [Amanita polypyramis BW_CC]
MDLPSTRELELEALLRQRDAQLANLTDEVTQLRQFLSSQPGPSTPDPVTLPPALVSVLLPHITSSSHDAVSGSGTVTAALSQRAQSLQEENDELYEILKHGETGRLKEEVRGLRRVVERLEKALRQSHHVIETLSAELEKSHEAFLTPARQSNTIGNAKANSHSSKNSYHAAHRAAPTGNGGHSAKILPTAPRAHKKPRLSEPRASPPSRSSASYQNHVTAREYHPRQHNDYRGKGQHSKMDVDNEQRRTLTPVHDRDRERDRERERGPKERDRDRDRDSRYSRRNGNFTGGSGRGGGGSGGRRTDRNAAPTNFTGDRTLAERLGL